jgi:hypothetical protein
MADEKSIARDLVLKPSRNLAVEQVNSDVARYRDDNVVRPILKETTRQVVALRGQIFKTLEAQRGVNQIYDHAHQLCDDFTRRVVERIHQEGRDPNTQAIFAAQSEQILTHHDRAMIAVSDLGTETIARELHRELYLPLQERRGWFR